MVQVDEKSNGTQITLATGETLEICLPENRTTGHKWFLESNSDVCASTTDNFQPGKATGEAGTHCWQFRAERAGSCNIELAYRRSWGKDETPARSFKLALQIS